jgi:SAM-dependent MidA family methyltransferase
VKKMILEQGPLPWSAVMRVALYDPTVGYYGSEVRKIGRQGDFYTAVSVGQVYGALLAEVAQRVWMAAGEPGEFIIAEQAGHDGQLAEDVWTAAQELLVGKVMRWVSVEPQGVYQTAQAARLQPLMGDRVCWVDGLSALSGCGLLICNELLDALPVERVKWDGESWQTCAVGLAEDGETLEWTSLPYAGLTEQLPNDPELGFTTETHMAMADWAGELGHSGWHGAVLVADYGYDAETYFAPERNDGTLRRYSQHGVDGKVLEALGDCDLTAHIDFTLLRQRLEAGGFQVEQDLPQGRFLTLAGWDWLKRMALGAPKEQMGLMRQFQSLTHPGHMGAAFRIMLVSRGLTSGIAFPTLGV